MLTLLVRLTYLLIELNGVYIFFNGGYSCLSPSWYNLLSQVSLAGFTCMCVMYDSTLIEGYPHKNLPFTLRKTVEITESAGKKTWRKGRCCE